MNIWDAVGYLASAFVFAAFCMKDMIPLRLVAVCSNVAFLTYGLALGLIPVWLLHAILLPINCWRLWQGLSAEYRIRKTAILEYTACTGTTVLALQKAERQSAPRLRRSHSKHAIAPPP
jgi:hypothetical protein